MCLSSILYVFVSITECRELCVHHIWRIYSNCCLLQTFHCCMFRWIWPMMRNIETYRWLMFIWFSVFLLLLSLVFFFVVFLNNHSRNNCNQAMWQPANHHIIHHYNISMMIKMTDQNTNNKIYTGNIARSGNFCIPFQINKYHMNTLEWANELANDQTNKQTTISSLQIRQYNGKTRWGKEKQISGLQNYYSYNFHKSGCWKPEKKKKNPLIWF